MACSINILSMVYQLGQHWTTEKLSTEGFFWKGASLSGWPGKLGLFEHCHNIAALFAAEAQAFWHTDNAKAECMCFFHDQAKHFWCFLLFCLIWCLASAA